MMLPLWIYFVLAINVGVGIGYSCYLIIKYKIDHGQRPLQVLAYFLTFAIFWPIVFIGQLSYKGFSEIDRFIEPRKVGGDLSGEFGQSDYIEDL